MRMSFASRLGTGTSWTNAARSCTVPMFSFDRRVNGLSRTLSCCAKACILVGSELDILD